MSLRIDSNFSVGSLQMTLKEPILHTCDDLPEPKYECRYDGVEFHITVNGRHVLLDISSEFLRKIRHEVVSDVMLFESDKKLSTIGVLGEEGELSPDFIDEQNKSVLELGTTAISEMFSLRNAYTSKHVKYNYLIEPLGYTYFILIVSPSRVYCNSELSQDVVNSLCYRMRIGMALESVIGESLGHDIFSEDLTADEAIVKDTFRGMKFNTVSMPDFDLKKIYSTDGEPTTEEQITVGRILREALAQSTKKSTETSADLLSYLNKFDENSQINMKRVTNIPLIYQYREPSGKWLETDEQKAKGMPAFLKKIWGSSHTARPETLSRDVQIEEAIGTKKYERHRVQKGAAYKVKTLSYKDKVEAAKTGLWAKSMKDHPEITEKNELGKLSFHPTLTQTSDIQLFSEKILLERQHQSIVPDEIIRLIRKGKDVWRKKRGKSLSHKIFKALTHTVASNFGQTVSNYMTEICYSHKYWIKRSDFYHKVHRGVHILIRATGDHIFAMFAFPKESCKSIETGRIGPQIWESPKYYFTDVCSFNEPTIEHFVKCGPYLVSILSHLLSHLELDLDEIDLSDANLNEHFSNILLLYLCNKTDCEELITSQRYLTMGILEDLDPNPYRFCDRLPTVIRSRLTCYFIKKTIQHMEYYEDNKVLKVPNKDNLEYDISYVGLKSLFGSYEPSLKQKINEFYFGYVVSKERGRGSDRNFKIMKKIVEEEYRFRDTITSTLENSSDPKIHVSNPIVIKLFVEMFKGTLKSLLGKDYMTVIKNEIVRSMAMTSFEDLATLKVSSRTYKEKIVVPSIKSNQTTKEIRELYEKSNPSERERRPRVMESISKLVELCENVSKKKIRHPVELLPFCLKDINRKGYWDSDIFPKSQHGGDREIHVLEVRMRVIQYFTECISRSLCRLIPSDTLTHPYEKESFVKKHYSESSGKLGEQFFTMGKSADATKWCQRNDSSKFAAVIHPFLPDEFKPFFIHVMYLWKLKRISFPIQFAANFQSNRKIKANPIYSRMREEFFDGTGIFSQSQSNKMNIRSGMMQGILHYTSSFTHTMIQEVMKKIQMDYLARRGVNSHVTVVQGSDDSAELISLPGSPSVNKMRIATTMLHWKESMSKHFSIYTNRAKSSIGALDLIEYNSEWMVRTNVVKPTFRWVSACMETNVTERFIDRIRINYNVSSQVLEGGGKVLEVAMVQQCQAWLHYLLVGLHTSSLADYATEEIEKSYDPSLGFYPLDSDYCAGITGVDFQLYKLFTKTNYGVGLSFANVREPNVRFEEDELPDQSVSKSLRSVKIKFSDMKVWQSQIRRMGVPELEKLISEVEKNPYLIYSRHKNWNEAKYSIFLKMFQPGVKESISTYSATARVMAASAYMISRPCVSIYQDGEPVKMSLLKALITTRHANESKRKLEPHEVFSHAAEYAEVAEYIDDLEEKSLLLTTQMRTRSKQKIIVFDRTVDDIPLIDLCRKKWFGIGKLPLSKRQVDTFWEEAKVKYPFIHDSRRKTKELLNMNEVELKGLLESMVSKPRHIILLDTSAKSPSLFNSLTRIFWTGIKVSLPGKTDEDENSYSLRSKIFSIATSWYNNEKKEQLIKDLIMSSKLLEKIKVPAKVRKLKVLRNFFTGKPKSSIVQYISDENLGTIGFFTSRQTGWGKTRSGLGEWRGKCLDVSVLVKMKGNVCTEIILSKLVNLRVLGPILLELMTSFSLEPPKRSNHSSHWLAPNGRLLGGAGKNSYYPVTIDQSLVIDIVDRISDYNWTWSIGNNRIRLQAEYTEGRRITVLSEPFTARDWDSSYEIEDDELLSYWSSGKPIPLDKIEQEIRSVCNFLPGQMMAAYRTKHLRRTKSGWSLNDFLLTVKRQLLHEEEVILEPEQERHTMIAQEVDEMDINSMLNALNATAIDDSGWAAAALLEEEEFDDDEDFDMDLFQVSADSELMEQVVNQIALFSVNPKLEESLVEDKTIMPKSNLSLSHLNNLSRLLLGDSSLHETVKKFKKHQNLVAPGILGVILTFLIGRVCLQPPSNDDRVMSELESSSVAIAVNLAGDQIIDNISLPDIEERIEYLKSTINNSHGERKEKLTEVLKNYENAKLQAVSKEEGSGIESIRIINMVSKLKEHLIKKNHVPDSYRLLNDSVFLIILRAELDSKVDEMTKNGELNFYQQSVYREAIQKPHLTSLFLDCLAFKYNLKIRCCGYVTNGTELFRL